MRCTRERWRRFAAWKIVESEGTNDVLQMRKVARYYGTSRKSIYDWISKMERTGNMGQSRKSGRPIVYDSPQKKRIVDTLNGANGRSLRATARVLKMESEQVDDPVALSTYNGAVRTSPCIATISQIKREGKRLTTKVVPNLTAENKRIRLEFAQKEMGLTDSERNRRFVAIDEKYFRLGEHGTRTFISHKNGTPPTPSVLARSSNNKLHPPQILAMVVLARPRIRNRRAVGKVGRVVAEFDKHLTGKVALVRVIERTAYKRRVTKKNKAGERVVVHQPGDEKFKSVSLSGELYKQFLTEDRGSEPKLRSIFKQIRAYYGDNDTSVRFQEDGAPGHGFNNRAKRAPTTHHEEMVQIARSMNIIVFKQPPNSPDTNPCDLGVLRSLDARFQELCAELPMDGRHDNGYLESQMWDRLQRAWDELPSRVIWNTFMEREVILRAIIKNKGGHVIDEPHTGIRERWGTWEPADF